MPECRRRYKGITFQFVTIACFPLQNQLYLVHKFHTPSMPALIGLFVVGLTLPLWGGALAAVVGGGFFLLIQYPLPFLLVGGAVLLAATMA